MRVLLRQKGLMPLQNLFILNVYQIANPACQLCNFCYKFHPRRLFLSEFFPRRCCFPVQATLHLVVHFQASSCRASPSPLATPSPQAGRSHFSLGTDSDTPSALPCNPHFSSCSAKRSRAQSLSRSNLQDYSSLKPLCFLVWVFFLLLLLFAWFIPSFHSNGFIFVAVSVFVHCCSRYQQHD